MGKEGEAVDGEGEAEALPRLLEERLHRRPIRLDQVHLRLP